MVDGPSPTAAQASSAPSKVKDKKRKREHKARDDEGQQTAATARGEDAHSSSKHNASGSSRSKKLHQFSQTRIGTCKRIKKPWATTEVVVAVVATTTTEVKKHLDIIFNTNFPTQIYG